MRLNPLGLVFSSLCLVLLHAEKTQAQVVCSKPQSCRVSNMPLVDQNHTWFMQKWGLREGGTSLCGPAAVTMAISSLIESTPNILVPSVTHFLSTQAVLTRVDHLAGLMRTNRVTGTTPQMMAHVFTSRARDFKADYSASWVENSKTIAANHGVVLSQMQAGHVSVIQYGHYTMKCKSMIGGSQRCVFSRSGGHAMAIKAINANEVIVFDPDRAVVRTNQIRRVPLENTYGQKVHHIFPSSFSAASAFSLTSSGHYFGLIENIVSVGGRSNRR